MKQSKLKVSSLFLSIVFALTLVLSGCGGKGNSDTKTTPVPAATDAPVAKETAAPVEKVTLEMWVNKFEDFNANWYKKAVDEFNKAHENIKINLSVVPGDAWAAKLKTAQAAGTAPEIVNMPYHTLAPASVAGSIMSMDEYVDPAIWNDLYENVNQFVSVKGKHYAYPMFVEPSTVLYYRKDFFTEAGLDPEKPPVTWDELYDYAKKLTKNGRFGISIAGNAPDFSWTTWGLQMGLAGHRPINDDWSAATLVDEGYKNLISFYKRLHDDKSVPKQALSGYPDITPFGQSKVAMAMNGSWAMGSLRNDFKDIVDKVGVAAMPTLEGDPKKATAALGGWTLAIDGKAKHPKEAAEAITWILGGDPALMMEFFKAAGYSKFPARKSVDEALNADPEAQNDVWRKTIAEQIVPYAVSEPTYPWEISFAVGTAIENVILKGTDPEAALKQAEKEINDFIASKKLAGTNPAQ